jgi:thioredoxin 1
MMAIKKSFFFVSFFVLFLVTFACAKKNKEIALTNSNSQAFQVTFIELGSVRCVPCKMMQPVIAEIEKEFAGKVKVVFYDVWTPEGQPYGQYYKIRAIPTQVFLDKDGKEFFRHEGYFPKEGLAKVLESQGVK